MIETLQVEASVHLHEVPKLLVEWSPRWREFRTSLGPALGRSEPRLAGEAPFGLIPLRISISSWLLEALLIFAAIIIPTKLAQMRPYVAPRLSSHDVIYYSGDELPRTEDLGGAQSGASGRAGGAEAHHRTQTIKVARGRSLTEKVVDAPDLKLPASTGAVANLLAVKPNPGPPPLEGARSSRTAPNLASAIVAPAPNVIRDYTRNGIAMATVVPPAPNFSRDQPLTAPTLNPDVIPPAPKISNEHALVAPALAPAVIPPAPRVARDRAINSPSLNAVVEPAPRLSAHQTRATPTMAASVIPPAPGGVSRELSSAPVQMSNVAVVPPPVSAPERASMRDPKLSMPSPAVIAPPPSSDMSRDMRRLASGSVPDPSKSVVPPPPTQSGSGSFMSSLIGKLFGATDVVPPPPSVNSSGGNGNGSGSTGGNPRGQRNGTGADLGGNVIAPPPTNGVSGGTGTRTLSNSAAPGLGPPSVVPPPPSLSGPGGGTGNNGGGAGVQGGTLLASNVVPPPPSVGGGSGSNGSGTGRRGIGQGGVMDMGSAASPPSNGGSGTNTGVVISSQPGSKVGKPSTGGSGSLAMSPSGGDKPGLGGSGDGTGIGHGNGPGSGFNGEGPGSGRTGAGRGSDVNARGGISPGSGPGGAGNGTGGTPSVPGVSVSGGDTIVSLPSFGSDPPANDPAGPGHSNLKQRATFDVDVVATAGSASAFEPYKKLLHGEQHTTYVDTSLGQVVVEYADENSAQGSRATLKPPRSVRTDLPTDLKRARMVVACTLDASGNVRNVRVLERGPADMTAKVLTAMRSWKFQPALRGDKPVEVTAILGFGIDTNDRF